MTKLFIALIVALLVVPGVLAVTPGITGRVVGEGDSCSLSDPCNSGLSCCSNVCATSCSPAPPGIPEFTSAGIGLALSGATIGYCILRRKFRN